MNSDLDCCWHYYPTLDGDVDSDCCVCQGRPCDSATDEQQVKHLETHLFDLATNMGGAR